MTHHCFYFVDMHANKPKEVINNYSEEHLANIIYEYGEEKFSRRIAKNICEYRQKEKITTTEKLVEIAKDVWVYDLGKDVNDFKTVELYVKPEESAVYYVVNAEVTGCFAI